MNQLLIRTYCSFQNGANIKHTDHEGRTCLAYARAAQSLATAKSIKAAAAAQAGTTIPAPAPPTNGGIPAPQYNVEDTTALVELLEDWAVQRRLL